jgi:hypothetical protein
MEKLKLLLLSFRKSLFLKILLCNPLSARVLTQKFKLSTIRFEVTKIYDDYLDGLCLGSVQLSYALDADQYELFCRLVKIRSVCKPKDDTELFRLNQLIRTIETNELSRLIESKSKNANTIARIN